MSAPRLSVVIVDYRSAPALSVTLPALRRELRDDDELIVVDNNRDNVGFAEGCNRGAARAAGDLLVFLNPDAAPEPGWGEAIRRPFTETDWAAWQALVLTPDGQVNTSGNVIHFTGIAWAGAAPAGERREVAYASGACLAVRRPAFDRAGGFAAGFFMYHEDLDLCLRLRHLGERVGVEPAAQVVHDYEYLKGGYKWRLMERNRWAVLARCWPARLLAVTLPALVAAELAVWAAALAGGWGREKARATGEALVRMPAWLRQRRAIERRLDAERFAELLTHELSSPFLGRAAESGLLRAALGAYWRVALRVMRAVP